MRRLSGDRRGSQPCGWITPVDRSPIRCPNTRCVKRLLLSGALALAIAASADELTAPAAAPSDLRVGDCVTFREGGDGLIFRTPTYWLKGSVAGIYKEQRLAGRCPIIGRPRSAYTRDDWVRLAASSPCVNTDAEVREVSVLRISMVVEDWETPWSNLHGTAGWLFRGQFLDKPLIRGALIDMDSSWLERCEAR